MSLTRTEQSELKFHERQAKVLTKRLAKMGETAAKLLAKKTSMYQGDLAATNDRIRELNAKA